MDRYEEGPDPNDLEGWRQVIQSGSIRRIRSERLVAAAQKIGPRGDQRILNALMLEITRRIMGMLRKCVGRQYRDEG